MYLSDLCSTKNAVFTGFVRFPQLYPPETKTPLDAKVIAPGRGAYPGNKPMALSRLSKVTTGFTFLTTGFKVTWGVHFLWQRGSNALWGGFKSEHPSADRRRFSNRPKSKQGIPATANVPEPLVFSGFPDILFIPFVSNKRFTFQTQRHYQYCFELLFYMQSSRNNPHIL